MQLKDASILITDDDPDVLTAVRLLLKPIVKQVVIEKNPENLPSLLQTQHFDLILLDMNFKSAINTGNEGFFWLSKIKSLKPDTCVIMITAYGDIDLAVRSLKQGASDFVIKPWHNDLLIETIGEALLGTGKPFLITSGTALFSKEGITTEKDRNANNPHPRIATENAADAVAAKGVKVAVIRLSPSVHGKGDVIGFVPTSINIAKQKGISAIINDGNNFWPAVHRLDAAKLYRLALEKPFVSGTRYHAVAEQGIPFKIIAAAIAERLQIPVASLTSDEAAEHFGWFAHFAKLNNLTSSEETKKALDWTPQHPTLMEDLHGAVYFSEL